MAYRATTFSEAREALLRPLPGESSLSGWVPAPGDLGLQVLEWWAYLGDILTFYNERIANEDYLRTVTMPANLAGLVDLIGYQPQPGVAATGQVAALRSTSHPDEPMIVPQGAALASTATPGVPSQQFEVSSTQTFEGPATLPVVPYPDPAMVQNADGSGPVSVLVAGKVSGAKVGDSVLLVGKVTEVQYEGAALQLVGPWQGVVDNWCWTTVTGLTPQVDANTGKTNTVVTFAQNALWGTSGSALAQQDLSVVLYELLVPARATTLWSRAVPDSASVVSSDFCGPVVHLNDSVRSIVAGDLVLLDGGGLQPTCLEVVLGSPEYTWFLPSPAPASSQSLSVTSGSGSSATTTSDSSTTPASVLYPHTALELFGTPDDETTILSLAGLTDFSTIAVRYGFKAIGTVMAVPQQSIGALPVAVEAPAGYVPSATTATAMLVDSTGTGVLVDVTPGGSEPPGAQPLDTIELTLAPAGSAASTLSPALVAPFHLLFDLVPVVRGTTVPSETLGSGDATRIGQSFPLQKSPLTYLSVGATVQSALTVYVNGQAWTEVRSFYGQAPTATVYVVSLDTTGAATVTFGDGVNGARLPTGSGNITATYRYGSGAAAPPAGRLTTVLKPQPNLASIANPIAVSGGADPQTPAGVRSDAPASVFTFGRAISALDYQVVAEQAPGVSQAQSLWGFDSLSQRTTVTIYVAGLAPTGASGTAAQLAAQSALAGSDDPNRPVTVLVATPIPLAVAGTVVVADDAVVADVLAAALAALSDPVAGPFSPSGCPISSRLYRGQLDAALFVPGVVAVQGLTATGSDGAGPVDLDEFVDPGVGGYFIAGGHLGGDGGGRLGRRAGLPGGGGAS